MKTENKENLIKAAGWLSDIIDLLEIEDSVFGAIQHKVKIKYLAETIENINQVLKDEHEPVTT